MFLQFILGALRYRKQRLLLAFSALAVAATLATVLFGIYGTIEQRMRNEFRSYGANIIAVPAYGTTVPIEMVQAARELGAEASPWLVTSGRLQGELVPVVGFIPAQSAAMTSYWQVQGKQDVAPGACLAGELVASRFQLKIGSKVALKGGPCSLSGMVSTGGAEDQEILVPFETAVQLSGVRNAASLVQIRAPGERVEAVRQAIANRFPAADVRTVRSVAGTESNVVTKIRASVFLLALLILVITTLCVSSNFTEMVLERSKEIGILKALGGAERRIASFFLSEALALAFIAAIVGYVAGLFVAAAVGRQIFGAAFQLKSDFFVLSSVTAVMLAVAAVATVIAASRIWRIQPAAILRGE